MIIEEAVSILAPMTGYCHNLIRRSSDAGKEISEAKKVRVMRTLENLRKKVQPVYNSREKLIEYDDYGRHLDIRA